MDDVSPAVSRGVYKSMIRKSGSRFSLETNTEAVCPEIMLKQRDEIMIW
jgi:hypothetical protein